MNIVSELIAGVNQLEGQDRVEYGSFIAGLLSIQCAAADRFGKSADQYVIKTFKGVTKGDMMGIIMASGIKPREGEQLSEFNERIRAWPMFGQLSLIDDEADFIDEGEDANPSGVH